MPRGQFIDGEESITRYTFRPRILFPWPVGALPRPSRLYQKEDGPWAKIGLMGTKLPNNTVKTTALSVWKTAVEEYLELLKLSPEDTKMLREARTTTDVVKSVLESQSHWRFWKPAAQLTDAAFLASVISAQTHEDFVKDVVLPGSRDIPEPISRIAGSFLQYAHSFDVLLNTLGSTTCASPFIFGALRIMLRSAVRSLNLFTEVRDQFEKVSQQLLRLDTYLKGREATDVVIWICIRALVDILRFCGLATKYFQSSVSPALRVNGTDRGFRAIIRPKTNLKYQLEEVIQDLNKDTILEIAAGVVQANYSIERLREEIGSKGFGNRIICIAYP